MAVTLLWWWLALLFLGFCALPLCIHLFGNVTHHPYFFAKTVGLLVVSYVLWLSVSLGLLRLHPLPIGGIAVLVFGISSSRRLSVYRTLPALIRQHWRQICQYEALFAALLAFGLWLCLQSASGGSIWRSESPWNLALLSSLLHSSRFPPPDPWLAGFTVNYYYFGYVPIAVLAKLSRAPGPVAFNLGLATTFALTAFVLLGLLRTLVHQPAATLSTLRSKVAVWLPAIAGVAFVLLMGNQYGLSQIVLHDPRAVVLDGPQMATALLQKLAGQETILIDPPVATTIAQWGVVAQLESKSPTPYTFNWWWAARSIWDRSQASDPASPLRPLITELPFFSLFIGALHPHFLVLPYTALLLALVLTLLAGGHSLARLGMVGICLGILFMTNAWEMPTAALLVGGALLSSGLRDSNSPGAGRRLLLAAREILGVYVLAGFSILPFLQTFTPFAGQSSIPPIWADHPIFGRIGASLLPVPDHTSLFEFLVIFGVHIGILFFFLIPTTWALSLWQRRIDQFALVICAISWLAGMYVGFPLLVLLPLGLWMLLLTLRKNVTVGERFVLLLWTVGAFVLLGTDTVYVRDFSESRINTVFKFYYQAWTLWGVAGACSLWAMQRRASSLAFLPEKLLRSVQLTLVGGLLLGAFTYPVATLLWGNRWIESAPSLDGLQYARGEIPDESAALEWIETNTAPSDIVLSGIGPAYRPIPVWPSSVTARPTLLGWPSSGHVRLWQGSNPLALQEIEKRERDVPIIYTTQDPALAAELLHQYNVRYVFVGRAEEELYGPHIVERLSPILDCHFQRKAVFVCRVNISEKK